MSHAASLHNLQAVMPELAAEARARASEFEELRRLPADFAGKLKSSGVFRLLVPAAAGGLAASLNDWFELMLQLAEADASTAWTCAHGSICAGLIYASAEPRFRDEFFADSSAYAAWSNLPRVEVREEDKGLWISGNWSFETGCTLATYVGGMVVLPPLADGAARRMLTALVPVSEARIVEAWDPIGLAGTGSHDVHFDNLFVPWHRTFPWPSALPVSEYPAAIFVPGVWFISMGAAATHLGLARRALDEARKELHGKLDRYSQRPLLEHASVQRSLEAAEGLWFACRAGMREALRAMWDCAQRGEPATQAARLDARVAAVTAVHRAAEIVRAAYDTTGASAVRRGGVLQRLLREASCLTHHVSVNAYSYEATGRVRSGVDELTLRV